MRDRGSFTSREISVYDGDAPKRGEEKENRFRLLYTYQVKIKDIRHDVEIKSPVVEYKILKDAS